MPKSLLSRESVIRAGVIGLFKDLVEGFSEAGAVGPAVRGDFFGAVGNPEIMKAGAAEFAAEEGADLAASADMFDPKPPDGFIPDGSG